MSAGTPKRSTVQMDRKPLLHEVVSDGEIIGIVTRRQGSRVHVLVGHVVTLGKYGNRYDEVEYGYRAEELTSLGYTLKPWDEAAA
jgi:hypothetical protein